MNNKETKMNIPIDSMGVVSHQNENSAQVDKDIKEIITESGKRIFILNKAPENNFKSMDFKVFYDVYKKIHKGKNSESELKDLTLDLKKYLESLLSSPEAMERYFSEVVDPIDKSWAMEKMRWLHDIRLKNSPVLRTGLRDAKIGILYPNPFKVALRFGFIKDKTIVGTDARENNYSIEQKMLLLTKYVGRVGKYFDKRFLAILGAAEILGSGNELVNKLGKLTAHYLEKKAENVSLSLIPKNEDSNNLSIIKSENIKPIQAD